MQLLACLLIVCVRANANEVCAGGTHACICARQFACLCASVDMMCVCVCTSVHMHVYVRIEVDRWLACPVRNMCMRVRTCVSWGAHACERFRPAWRSSGYTWQGPR